MRDTVRRNRLVAQEITGVVDTRFAEKIWPFVELLGVITVILSGVLGVVSPVIVVLYLLLGILFGSAQSVSAALLEEYAFQRQTDTGLLLHRYLLAIFDNIGFRLLTSLVRVFS